VRLVAVSKTQPAEAVIEAIAAGVDAIGENRIQEAATKRSQVTDSVPWHLIGTLQRNKARAALELFEVVETVNREEIADRLELLLAKWDEDAPTAPPPRAAVLPVFLEVNVGREPQKSGVTVERLPILASHVLDCCPHLRLAGLMAVPPYDPDPERSRPHFATLRTLADALRRRLGPLQLELSMGMSEDFTVAVEEGADWVRLGRTVFGARREAV
jgi:pyridoxal phosphate enzyme (YggS family)